jgi:anthranilate phosphoribosyltransferase
MLPSRQIANDCDRILAVWVVPTQMTSDWKVLLSEVRQGRDLSQSECRDLIDMMIGGQMGDSDVSDWLLALSEKGECVDELVGAAEAMRSMVLRVRAPHDTVDTCGTGGDGVNTFNVSTAAAIVLAATGVSVAKHGNRSNRRTSGSTDVLESLGVDVDAPLESVEQSLSTLGICYLNARRLHPAMGRVADVRASMGCRSLFNLLGPLTNPAGVRRQVVGVPEVKWLRAMAEAFRRLGSDRVWVVHGDGLCDLTVTGVTNVVELAGGRIGEFEVRPEDAGLESWPIDDLLVSSPYESAAAIRCVLNGEPGAKRSQVLLNAAAGLVVAGRCDDLKDGVQRCAQAIDSMAARDLLDEWTKLQPTKSARPQS